MNSRVYRSRDQLLAQEEGPPDHQLRRGPLLGSAAFWQRHLTAQGNPRGRKRRKRFPSSGKRIIVGEKKKKW